MTELEKCLLTRLVVAVDRMRDQWAAADKATRNALWTQVHATCDIVAEAFGIYPLEAA